MGEGRGRHVSQVFEISGSTSIGPICVNSSDPLYRSVWVVLSRETSLWTYIDDLLSMVLSLIILSLMLLILMILILMIPFLIILFLVMLSLMLLFRRFFVFMGLVLDTSVLKRRIRRGGAMITFRRRCSSTRQVAWWLFDKSSKSVDAVDRELRLT